MAFLLRHLLFSARWAMFIFSSKYRHSFRLREFETICQQIKRYIFFVAILLSWKILISDTFKGKNNYSNFRTYYKLHRLRNNLYTTFHKLWLMINIVKEGWNCLCVMINSYILKHLTSRYFHWVLYLDTGMQIHRIMLFLHRAC